MKESEELKEDFIKKANWGKGLKEDLTLIANNPKGIQENKDFINKTKVQKHTKKTGLVRKIIIGAVCVSLTVLIAYSSVKSDLKGNKFDPKAGFSIEEGKENPTPDEVWEEMWERVEDTFKGK